MQYMNNSKDDHLPPPKTTRANDGNSSISTVPFEVILAGEDADTAADNCGSTCVAESKSGAYQCNPSALTLSATAAAAPSSSLSCSQGQTERTERSTVTRNNKQDEVAGASQAFYPVILCPLRNLGNTCYFNSGVQMLCNCPAFVYGIRESPYNIDACRNNALLLTCSSLSMHALFKAFAQLLHDMEFKQLAPHEAIAPVAALNQLADVYCAFEGRRQQDCAEMISALLSNTEDENRIVVDVDTLLQSLERTAASSGRNLSSRSTEPFHMLEDVRLSDISVGASLSGNSPPLPGSLSASTFTMLHLMRRVNEENRALEAKALQRRNAKALAAGTATSSSSNFFPPKLFYNPSTDGFKGYSLSEITCHNCQAVSRVVQSYSSLMIDIPTPAQRRQFARRHPEIQRLGPNGEPLHAKKVSRFAWWNPLAYMAVAYHFLTTLFSPAVHYPLTLEECLDIHFEPAELHGSNKYCCESCGVASDATKTETLLALPEYLLVHMKRFKSGHCFMTKKMDPVVFPVSWSPLSEAQATGAHVSAGQRPEILDLRHYLHADVAASLAAMPPSLRLNRGAGTHVEGSVDGHLVSTYTLDGVVNHHGSLTGGHYTVYVRKQVSGGNDTWVYVSDDELEEANLSDVADSEEYVLLYRKQPVVKPHGLPLTLRNRARRYLLHAQTQAAPSSSQRAAGQSVVYISRLWLQRAAFLSDPGPMMNQQCYCNAEDRKRIVSHAALFGRNPRVPDDVPHVHGPPAEWYYIPVDAEDFIEFYEAFGGDAGLSEEQYQKACEEQARFLHLVKQGRRR